MDEQPVSTRQAAGSTPALGTIQGRYRPERTLTDQPRYWL